MSTSATLLPREGSGPGKKPAVLQAGGESCPMPHAMLQEIAGPGIAQCWLSRPYQGPAAWIPVTSISWDGGCWLPELGA